MTDQLSSLEEAHQADNQRKFIAIEKKLEIAIDTIYGIGHYYKGPK